MRQISLVSWMECAQSTIKDLETLPENKVAMYRPAAIALALAMDNSGFWANDELADEVAELTDAEQLRVQRTLERLVDLLDPDSIYARQVAKKIRQANAKSISASEQEAAERAMFACAG